MIKVSEQQIKDLLYKEAHLKREKQKDLAVREFLFVEANEMFGYEENEAKPFARYTGDKSLGDSGWNTVWSVTSSSRIDALRQDMEERFTNYFYNKTGKSDIPFIPGAVPQQQLPQQQTGEEYIELKDEGQQRTDNVKPGSIYFRFNYKRSILPTQHPEFLEATTSAIQEMGSILPNFDQFESAIEHYGIPLLTSVMESNPGIKKGGLPGVGEDEEESALHNFIRQEAAKSQDRTNQNPLYSNANYYKEHMQRIENGQDVSLTSDPTYTASLPMSELEKIREPHQLTNAILMRIKDGYGLNQDLLIDNIEKLKDEEIESLSYLKNDPRYSGHITNLEKASEDKLKRIDSWWHSQRYEENNWWKNNVENNPVENDLRIILRSMTPKEGGDVNDQYNMSNYNMMHRPNGFDTSDKDPNLKKLLITHLIRTPSGEILYDHTNGNMSSSVLVSHWYPQRGRGYQQKEDPTEGGGLSAFLEDNIARWGDLCVEWLKTMKDPQKFAEMSQRSEIAADTWKNVMLNRTSAETIADLLHKFPDYESFRANVLDKRFNQAIKTSHKFDMPSTEPSIFSPDANSIHEELGRYVEQLGFQLQNEIISPKTAQDRIESMSKQLVSLHNEGVLSFDDLSTALFKANEPFIANKKNKLEGLSGNGMNPRFGQEYNTMIDQNGFNLLLKYGYPVAKMMDFLDALRIRSCREEIVGRGGSKHYIHGRELSNSSANSGQIILSAKYAYKLNEFPTNEETIKDIRKNQSARHIRARDVLNPQTMHPQQGNVMEPFPQTETNEGEENITGAVTVMEDIKYFLGQGAGTYNFAKTLEQDLPWRLLIARFERDYPQIGDQLGSVIPQMNINLKRIEMSVKRAIDMARKNEETRQAFAVKYKSDEGTEELIGTASLDVQEQDLENGTNNYNTRVDNPEEMDSAAEIDPATGQPAIQQNWNTGYPQQIDQPEVALDFQQPNVNDSTLPQQPQFDANVANPDERKSMPSPILAPPPESNFVGKPKNQKKRLFVDRSQLGLASVEERLQKAANKLDTLGETKVADKIDRLLQIIQENKDV